MSAIRYDFKVWSGNTGIVPNEIGLTFRRMQSDGVTPADMSGAEVVFSRSDDVRKDSATGDISIDLVDGYVTIPFSSEETRSISNVVDYEVEVKIGASQRTWLYGRITSVGGINDD